MGTKQLLAILIGATVALGACGGGSTAQTVDLRGAREAVEGVEKGDLLPDVELTTSAGETVRVSELAGRPIIVNFWATWCEPCKQEIPILEEAYQTHKGAGLELLAITDEDQATVERFQRDFEMSFPVLYDQRKRANTLFRVQGIPTTFFVDRNGVIVERHIGALGPNLLQIYVDKIMVSTAAPTSAPAQAAPTLPARKPTVAPESTAAPTVVLPALPTSPPPPPVREDTGFAPGIDV